MFSNLYQLGATGVKIGLRRCFLGIAMVLACFFLVMPLAWGDVESDRYDGNIFVLYAGDGSLVPASSTFKAALSLPKPVILAFYIDDSRDCKRFASVISHLKDFYGRVAVFVPINADSIPVKDSYQPDEPGYYYEGVVPQILVFDAENQVRLNGTGQVKYEEIDDVLREIFNLEDRPESGELQRRSYNEFSGELAE